MRTWRSGRGEGSEPAGSPLVPPIRTSPLHRWSSLLSSSDTSGASNKSWSSTCLHSCSSAATAFWLFMMITLPGRWIECPWVYGDQLPRRRHRFSIKEPLESWGTWWTKEGERWLTEVSSIICKTQAGRDNRANAWKYMTAPEDVIREVCEMTAGSGLDWQHLRGIECKGRGSWCRPRLPTVMSVESQGAKWNECTP